VTRGRVRRPRPPLRARPPRRGARLRLVASLSLAALLLTAPPPAAAGERDSATTAATRTVDAGGVTIAYRSIGTGRPVVLVMGLGGTMDAWDPAFVDALAAAGHRVVLLDNEGAGRSERRRGTLTIRRMGDNVDRLIRALGLKRPDVVGWSMGGMIAQSFAVRHPRSLRRLVLMATAPGDGRATPPSGEALGALGEGRAATALDLLFPPGARAVRDAYVRRLVRRDRAMPTPPDTVRRAQVAASAAWLTGQDPDGARVRRLRAPALVAGGALDPLLPVANQRRLAQIIPRARRALYADASHGFFMQRRRAFVPRLVKFLR
jgi:pimeloyl-ACP methyl ester carboxylesterase